jgi:hypothetical protein
MFEEVGHHVEKIRRVQYGPLALDVPPGDWRNLTLLEVAKLKTAAAGGKVTSPPSPVIALRAPKAALIKPRRIATPAHPHGSSRLSHASNLPQRYPASKPTRRPSRNGNSKSPRASRHKH